MANKQETKIEETSETVETPVVATAKKGQGIIVNDPLDIRPTELPLVITLPPDASKAQIEYAKTLNAYAYKNPVKWAAKRDDKIVNGVLVKGLITKLEELKFAPDPIEGNLKINNSFV